MTPFRVALLLLTLCGVAAWQVSVIPESMMQMTVGPVLAPAVIVAALSAFAVLSIRRSTSSKSDKISSTSMTPMSRSGSTEPSTWTISLLSKQRTT